MRKATADNLTPPELAAEWRVDVHTVLAWIRSGELDAANVARSLLGRPRYRIAREAANAFWRRRTAKPLPRGRKKKAMTPAEVLAWLGVNL